MMNTTLDSQIASFDADENVNDGAAASIINNGNGDISQQSTSRRLRCAIYTRKSSEEGLEQDFNSLDAQREACEAYIASQASLGWRQISKQYDDGGISGGTMNRPALKELLEDIRKGRVDVVVVYKIDRLTRSLMDFAKMVDVFDGKNVSFVSVTQQFNTTTSMGRLTLNVLLSFAQFEREVTGERIRDKIAASKKKGMWMGGKVPLGYKIEDRKLLINEQEAETVRHLFSRYLELGAVTKLVEDAKANGLSGRVVHQKNGVIKTSHPFGRGNLYHLLSSPIYIGKVTHKGQIYDGQHEAIVDQNIWDQVQNKLKRNAVNRKLGVNSKSRNLLTGLLYDVNGNRLTPSHANKKGVRYSYYVSRQLIEGESQNEEEHASDSNDSQNPKTNWRIPSREIDQAVANVLNDQLTDQTKLHNLLPTHHLSVEAHQSITKAAQRVVAVLNRPVPIEQRKQLSKLLNRVELHQNKIVVEIDVTGLQTEIAAGSEAHSKSTEMSQSAQLKTYRIEVPYKLKKRGVEARLIIGPSELREAKPDHNLIMLIAKAHDFMNKLTNGTTKSIAELAIQENYNASKVSKLLQLTFLAPDIIESILAGTQPPDLTSEKLRRLSSLPIHWQGQRELLGFAA